MVTLYLTQLIIVSHVLLTNVYSEDYKQIEGNAIGCPSLNITHGCRATFVNGSASKLGDFMAFGSIIRTWLFGTFGVYRYIRCQEDGHYNATTFCLSEDYLTRCNTNNFKSVRHLMLSSNQSTFLTGRVLHFSCEPGFLLEGPTSIYCKTNNTWSEKRIPRCSGCPHPGHLGNGYFINSKGVTYIEGVKAVNEIITVHCNRNFTLQGGRRIRTCLKEGGWSNGGQTCAAASCKPPENFTSNGTYTFPDGVNVSSRIIQIGDKLILTCEQGFSSMENDYAVCQKGGKWSYGTGHGCRIVNSTNQVKIENDHGQKKRNDQIVKTAIIGAVSGLISIVLGTGITVFVMFKRRLAAREKDKQNSNYDSLTEVQGTADDHYEELQTVIQETGAVYVLA